MNHHLLTLDDYRSAVRLDEVFSPPRAAPSVGLGASLLSKLAAHDGPSPFDRDDLTAREALYARLIARSPEPFPEGFLDELDALLTTELARRAVTEARSLPALALTAYPSLDGVASLWRGDITALSVDAIVNAANGAMLGCFRPGHACVDNAIHAAAGPRLRDDCATIMRLQSFEEPVGAAKITRGYNLPSRFVVHTVGPAIARGEAVTDAHDEALASSYRASLDLASQVSSIRSIAFSSVSTGVFGFPPERAARVALSAVSRWIDAHPRRFDRVVFDVFSDSDLRVYRDALTNSQGAMS